MYSYPNSVIYDIINVKVICLALVLKVSEKVILLYLFFLRFKFPPGIAVRPVSILYLSVDIRPFDPKIIVKSSITAVNSQIHHSLN